MAKGKDLVFADRLGELAAVRHVNHIDAFAAPRRRVRAEKRVGHRKGILTTVHETLDAIAHVDRRPLHAVAGLQDFDGLGRRGGETERGKYEGEANEAGKFHKQSVRAE